MMIESHKKHREDTFVLKFFALHPFKEVYWEEGDNTQIIGVNYAGQEIKLRDFCEYGIKEILDLKFVDKEIDGEWSMIKFNYRNWLTEK